MIGSRSHSPTRGFTLMEIMLVMFVVIAATAIVWPNVIRWSRGDLLERGADHLRGLLVGLRVRAMEDGTPYHFSWQPGTNSYQIATELTGAISVTSVEPSDGSLDFDSDTLLGSHSLEDGLLFADSSQEAEQAETPATDGGTVPTTTEPIISFHPDGTTSDAAFLVTDELGNAFRVQVRSLTGTVSITRTSVNPPGSNASTAVAASGAGR